MTQSGESDSFYAPRWEVRIEHDGMWPTRWSWHVAYVCHRDHEFHYRSGEALTKDKARRRVAAARISIERDDLTVREVDGEAIR